MLLANKRSELKMRVIVLDTAKTFVRVVTRISRHTNLHLCDWRGWYSSSLSKSTAYSYFWRRYIIV